MSDVQRLTLWAPQFTRVDSVDQLGTGGSDHYVSLFPGGAKLPPVNVYAVANAMVGGNGLIRVGDQVFGRADAIPGYYRDAHEVWYKNFLADAGETIRFDTPVITVVQPNWVYGHVILEMLPKMFLAALLRSYGWRAPIVVTRHAPRFLREILGLYFAEDEIVYYDPETQRIAAPFVIVPSMMNWYYDLHPAMELMIDDLVARCRLRERSPGMPRIFLSRSRLPKSNDQRVQDPKLIDEVFLRYGFSLVHPQELGFVQQMLMYADADIIAGVAGSALHNSMFQKKRGRIISIGFRNELQGKLAAFRKQELVFLDPPGDAPGDGAAVQSLESFAAGLGEILLRQDGGVPLHDGLHQPPALLLDPPAQEPTIVPELSLFRDDLLPLGGYARRCSTAILGAQ